MPPIPVRVFRNAKGETPLAVWLAELMRSDRKSAAKCIAVIRLLGQLGHELSQRNQKLSKYLRDGVYELRIRRQKVNYRILYFFVHPSFACLSHGLKKQSDVPVVEIDRVVANMRLVNSDQETYTADFE